MSSEEALLREWSPANLEAFGAALRAQGHPRGELIAIDFVLEEERNAHTRTALLEEKKQLQQQWLGELGEKLVTRFGFVERIDAEPDDQALGLEVAAPYARSLRLWGTPSRTHDLVDRLVSAPRPFLASLRVRSFHEDRATHVIDDATARRLIDATPNLRTLHVSGYATFGDVPHPAVERLVVDGFDAVGALVGCGTMPNVRTLDFALCVDSIYTHAPPPGVMRAGLAPRTAFPQLAVLDLSRNEPRERTLEPNCLAGEIVLFDILDRFACLPHVAELRVPSVRIPAHAHELERIAQAHPSLRVTIARMYAAQHINPQHPRIAVPVPVPWPAASELRSSDALKFFRTTGKDWVRFDLGHAYQCMEEHYHVLTSVEAAAWRALWELVRELGTENENRVDHYMQWHTGPLCTSIANVDPEWYEEFGKHFIDRTDPVYVARINGWGPREEKPVGPRVVASSERIAEHERALQADFDHERLAVYADELQQHGDLRGNLIAVDLQYLRAPDVELSIQHDDLHDQIFGESYSVTSHLGLATVELSSYSRKETIEDVLTGDVACYLGEIELDGDNEWMDNALTRVCAEVRPWLRKAIFRTSGRDFLDWGRRLSVAAPHLEELEIAGSEPTHFLEELAHPRVNRMKITGVHALDVLGVPWPALTTLDFAYGDDEGDTPTDPDQLFRGEWFPALRTIDFSRNEPVPQGYDTHERHQCSIEFFASLAWLDDLLVAGLTHLTLPSPRSPLDVAAIQRLLDRAPAMESLVIARRYPAAPPVELVHPRAQIRVPPPVSWPPFDRLPWRAALAIGEVIVPLADLVSAMEAHYERLSESGRRAWDELWAIGDGLVSAETLYAAVDALLAVRRYYKPWVKTLATHLHPLALEQKTVTILRATR